MKKNVGLSVLFCFCILNMLNAQVKDSLHWSIEGNYGIELLDFAYQSGTSDQEFLTAQQNQLISPFYGWNAGINVSRKLNKNWHLNTGVAYMKKGENFDVDQLSGMLQMRNDFHWMSIPLLAKYQISRTEDRSLFIQGGIQWNRLVRSSRTYQSLGMNQSKTIVDIEGINTSALSTQLSIGWQWTLTSNWYGGVFLQGNYFLQSIAAQSQWDVRPWGCGFGIVFGKRR